MGVLLFQPQFIASVENTETGLHFYITPLLMMVRRDFVHCGVTVTVY